jgi:hypothetical protein
MLHVMEKPFPIDNALHDRKERSQMVRDQVSMVGLWQAAACFLCKTLDTFEVGGPCIVCMNNE